MSPPPTTVPEAGGRTLATIDVEECLRLLDGSNLGRLAFLRDGSPEVLPVNFILDEGSVVFRTGYDGFLDEIAGTNVAFEVDDVDPDYRLGWSVVVRGRAEEVWQSSELDRMRSLPLRAWASGERTHYVRILPASITGRRIAPAG